MEAIPQQPHNIFGILIFITLVLGCITVLAGFFLMLSASRRPAAVSRKAEPIAPRPEQQILDACQSLSSSIKQQKDAISSMELDMRSLKNEEFHLKENFEKASAKWTDELTDIKKMITKLEESMKSINTQQVKWGDLHQASSDSKVSLDTLKTAVFTEEPKPATSSAPEVKAEAPKEEVKKEEEKKEAPAVDEVTALMQKKKA